MTRIGAAARATVSLLALVVPISARMDTIRIVIKGGALTAPIQLTDPNVVRLFHVGAGPGNFLMLSNGVRVPNYPAQSFIVDWSLGITQPPTGVTVYEVSFVTTRTDRSTYIVRYGMDQATKNGYVYFPGEADSAYTDNVWMIRRGVEGHWFHAWSVWERIANSLISAAPKNP